jgi:hypothetical protein
MNNPPAFPVEMIYTQENEKFNGMTLRDYFAAKALQGLLANPKLQKEILAQGGCLSGWIEDSAYGFADAMLKAREP